MTKPTPAPATTEEETVGIATIAGREIKMKRLTGDQLMAADMMARRLQRLAGSQDEGGKLPPENWEKFMAGTRRLLDWLSGQFYCIDDLEWFEDKMLAGELTLGDMAPLMEAMGLAQESAPAPNRKARRAK